MPDFVFPEIDPAILQEILDKLRKEQSPPEYEYLYQEMPFHPCMCPDCCNPKY